MVYLMPLCVPLCGVVTACVLCGFVDFALAVAFCGVRYLGKLDGVPYALVCRFAFAVLRSLVWREVPGWCTLCPCVPLCFCGFALACVA